jgi:hypothetical protein
MKITQNSRSKICWIIDLLIIVMVVYSFSEIHLFAEKIDDIENRLKAVEDKLTK